MTVHHVFPTDIKPGYYDNASVYAVDVDAAGNVFVRWSQSAPPRCMSCRNVLEPKKAPDATAAGYCSGACRKVSSPPAELYKKAEPKKTFRLIWASPEARLLHNIMFTEDEVTEIFKNQRVGPWAAAAKPGEYTRVIHAAVDAWLFCAAPESK